MNTTGYKHGILGLALLSLMSFDAFAETRGSSLSGNHHSGQVTLDAVYGDKGNSHSSLDLLYPLYERSDAIAFVDVRGMSREGPVSEFNLGGGYRWLNDSQTQLYGVYGFFDAKQSALSNNYTQLTLGGEWKMAEYSLGGNVYLPLGSTEHELGRAPKSGASQAVDNGNGTFVVELVDSVNREYVMSGADIELGYHLPILPGLTTYLGAYYFDHKKAETIAGPRLSVQYDVLQHIQQAPSWLGNLDVVASIQHDAVRETLWSIGLQVRVPLGSKTKPKATGLHNALTATVRRDVDAVTADDEIADSFIWQKADGSNYVGMIVNDETSLNVITADDAKDDIDIIGVSGSLSYAGNAHINNTTEAAVVLKDGQMLTGKALTITVDGVTYDKVKIVNTKAANVNNATPSVDEIGALSLTPAAGQQSGHLLRVQNNNHIEDIHLATGIVTTGTKGQQSAAITNTKGVIEVEAIVVNDEGVADPFNYAGQGSHFEPFGDVVLKDVTISGGGIVYFNVAENAASESSVTIEGGHYTITNPYVGRAKDQNYTSFGAITLIDQGDGAKLSNHQLNGMTVDVTQNLSAENPEIMLVAGVAVSHLSGSISDNTKIGVSATGNHVSAGISVIEDMLGSSQISGNTFGDITSPLGGAIGISMKNMKDKSLISENQFTGEIFGGGLAYGIYSVTGNMIDESAIRGNYFAGIRSSFGMALGIYLFDTQVTGASISGNTFKKISAEDTGLAVGVFHKMSGRAAKDGNRFTFDGTMGCDASNAGKASCKNTFEHISSQGGPARGLIIVSLGDGSDSGIIRGNHFGLISAGGGAYIGMTGSMGMEVLTFSVNSTISGNTFGTVGVADTGIIATAGDVEAVGLKLGIESSEEFSVAATIGCAIDEDITSACQNIFENIESTQGVAVGVDAENLGNADGTAPGVIRGNTFGRIKGGGVDNENDYGATGIHIVTVINKNSIISGNTFGTAGVADTGIIATAGGGLARGVHVGVVLGTIGCGSTINDFTTCLNAFAHIESKQGGPTGVLAGNLGNADGTAPGVIRGNTFGTIKGAGALGISIGVINKDSIISGNTFGTAGDTDTGIIATAVNSPARGVHVGVFSGTIGCGVNDVISDACQNTFSNIESKQSVAFGVSATSLGNADGTAPGVIRGNTFGIIKGGANNNIAQALAVGISITTVNRGSIISGNTFGTAGDTDTGIIATAVNSPARGVHVGVFSGTIGCGVNDVISDACQNTFSNIESKQSVAFGVSATSLGNADGTAPGVIRGNTFGTITGGGDDGFGIVATGIIISGIMIKDSIIGGNTFGTAGDTDTGIISTGDGIAYGMYFEKAIGDAAANITNNTLSVTHTTTPANAIGISLAKGDAADKVALKDSQNNNFGGNIAPGNEVKEREA